MALSEGTTWIAQQFNNVSFFGDYWIVSALLILVSVIALSRDVGKWPIIALPVATMWSVSGLELSMWLLSVLGTIFLFQSIGTETIGKIVKGLNEKRTATAKILEKAATKARLQEAKEVALAYGTPDKVNKKMIKEHRKAAKLAARIEAEQTQSEITEKQRKKRQIRLGELMTEDIQSAKEHKKAQKAIIPKWDRFRKDKESFKRTKKIAYQKKFEPLDIFALKSEIPITKKIRSGRLIDMKPMTKKDRPTRRERRKILESKLTPSWKSFKKKYRKRKKK